MAAEEVGESGMSYPTNSTDDLLTAVLKWWDEHRYDCDSYDAGDGYMEDSNRYDEEPEFVKLAKRMRGDV